MSGWLNKAVQDETADASINQLLYQDDLISGKITPWDQYSFRDADKKRGYDPVRAIAEGDFMPQAAAIKLTGRFAKKIANLSKAPATKKIKGRVQQFYPSGGGKPRKFRMREPKSQSRKSIKLASPVTLYRGVPEWYGKQGKGFRMVNKKGKFVSPPYEEHMKKFGDFAEYKRYPKSGLKKGKGLWATQTKGYAESMSKFGKPPSEIGKGKLLEFEVPRKWYDKKTKLWRNHRWVNKPPDKMPGFESSKYPFLNIRGETYVVTTDAGGLQFARRLADPYRNFRATDELKRPFGQPLRFDMKTGERMPRDIPTRKIDEYEWLMKEHMSPIAPGDWFKGGIPAKWLKNVHSGNFAKGGEIEAEPQQSPSTVLGMISGGKYPTSKDLPSLKDKIQTALEFYFGPSEGGGSFTDLIAGASPLPTPVDKFLVGGMARMIQPFKKAVSGVFKPDVGEMNKIGDMGMRIYKKMRNNRTTKEYYENEYEKINDLYNEIEDYIMENNLTHSYKADEMKEYTNQLVNFSGIIDELTTRISKDERILQELDLLVRPAAKAVGVPGMK